MRARATARLQAEDPAEALKDLDAAQAAAPEIASDPFLRRNMGVSFLLRALARAEQGDAAGAVPDARGGSATLFAASPAGRFEHRSRGTADRRHVAVALVSTALPDEGTARLASV